MLELINVNKKFKKKAVLADVNFQFEHKVYGLLGPNGAGKTTLMRCITELYPINSGSIVFNGQNIAKSKDYLSKIGYLPQKFGMYKDLNVRDMLELIAGIKNIDKKAADETIPKVLERVNMAEHINDKVGTLSGGMIRRLGIAQALLNEPEIIIFDEPTAGLDPEERLRFKNIISEIKGDSTIIISTHIVEDVEAVCDSVAIMKDKKIAVSGSCKEIEDLAKGKVYLIPESDLSDIKQTYFIQNHLEHDGIKMVKVLSSEKIPYPQVEPDVEDGYICVLKNI